ncbi:MAG TPA: PilN domain-containing protein [Gemmatimonadales bacterium]|jgi:Tfp pilus assembly protein PilN|nr:PilN domain-containing protein [Gemmatimonadales bacterium]
MIEINLLPGKKKAPKGAGMKLSLPDFRGLLAQVKDPFLIGAVAAWVIVGGGGALLFITDRARMASAENRLETMRTEERKWNIVIAQKRLAEKVRDSLLHEINVIHGIDADRYIWPHVLDQATKALPPYTWITNVQSVSAIVAPAAGQPNGPVTVQRDSSGAPAVRVSIRGRTVDIQAYTTFLRQLAASPWFTDVTPAASQTVIEADRPVTEFTVTVSYRIADSVYIRTVPLVQSVR